MAVGFTGKWQWFSPALKVQLHWTGSHNVWFWGQNGNWQDDSSREERIKNHVDRSLMGSNKERSCFDVEI